MKNIETEKLILRELKETDLEDIYHNWASNDEVTKYLEWNTHETIEITKIVLNGWLKAYETKPCYRYGIVNKETNELMGMIDVVKFINDNEPFIGFSLGRKYWNQGYMSEALTSLLKQLKEDGYHKFHTWSLIENGAAIRVIEKNGFKCINTENRQFSNFKPVMVEINNYELEY